MEDKTNARVKKIYEELLRKWKGNYPGSRITGETVKHLRQWAYNIATKMGSSSSADWEDFEPEIESDKIEFATPAGRGFVRIVR